jgi:hypothetical protein
VERRDVQIDDGHLAPVLIQAWDNGGAVVQRGASMAFLSRKKTAINSVMPGLSSTMRNSMEFRTALVCKIPEQQACQREPGALMLCPLHGV